MKYRILIFFILIMNVDVFSQDINFSKIINLDSSIGAPVFHILLTNDNNIIISGNYQRNTTNGESNIFTVKTNLKGEITWSKTIKFPGYIFISDIIEQTAKISIPCIYNSKLQIYNYDIYGNLLNVNLDTTNKSNPFYPGYIHKYFNDLVSINLIDYNQNGVNFLIFGLLKYNLTGDFLERIFIDTVNYPNLIQLNKNGFFILNDNSLSSSYGTFFKDSTAPVYYKIFDSLGEKLNEFIVNTNYKCNSSSSPGSIFKAKNGNIILTGLIHKSNYTYFSFVRFIDSTGKILKDDTLNEESEIVKIIEDEDNNLIMIGYKSISTRNLFLLYYYNQNGLNSIKYIWGDSTKNQYLTDIISEGNGKCFITGNFDKQLYLAELATPLIDIKEKRILKISDYIIVNPVTDYLYLSLGSEPPQGELQIFSILGLKVFEAELSEKIDVSFLSPGVYFVKYCGKFSKFLKM